MTRSRSLLSTALLLTLAACTTPAPPANEEPLPPANAAPPTGSEPQPPPTGAPPPPASDGAPTSGPCDAAAASAAVGQQATADVLERVRRDSGARIARILHPGEIITMEFSADRVNVRVDAHNRILAVTCG